MDKKSFKKNNITQLAGYLLIIILVNFISSYIFTRFDLTSDKRYTLSEATKTYLKNLDDVVYFKIYLEGDMPPDMKELRNATKEMLDEFKRYAHNNIEYEFVEPFNTTDNRQRNQIYQQFVQKGLVPLPITTTGKSGSEQKILIPGAIVTYKEHEQAVNLFNKQIGVAGDVVVNNSIQSLEYELASGIRRLTATNKANLAFIEGHGELNDLQTADITKSLNEYYNVKRIRINSQLKSLDGIKAIIIAKPDSLFSEKDKFIIDQFIMKGGKVLWLIDPVYAEMDSLKNSGRTVGFPLALNLEDQLFKYGIRLNVNLVQDLYSAMIPINAAPPGAEAKFQPYPWYFFPLITPQSKHVIVKNLNAIKLDFVSSIDTLKNPAIKKTILLSSSQYSKTTQAPVEISLATATRTPDMNTFTKSNQIVAVLLEGQFNSVFKNRLPEYFVKNSTINFKDKSIQTKMIIVSDGDIIRNAVHYATLQPSPLGYDKWTGQTFGNKTFLLNAINFLLDDAGLITSRSREIKLRTLDKTAYNTDSLRMTWQIINVLVPIILIILIGMLIFIFRKRKYTNN